MSKKTLKANQLMQSAITNVTEAKHLKKGLNNQDDYCI
jgi:hypothetical protein